MSIFESTISSDILRLLCRLNLKEQDRFDRFAQISTHWRRGVGARETAEATIPCTDCLRLIKDRGGNIYGRERDQSCLLKLICVFLLIYVV